MTARVFRREPLVEIIAYLEAALATAPAVAIRVLDPDRGAGHYAGALVDGHVHRPLHVWCDLAERLALRLGTPRVVEDGLVELVFARLDLAARWDRDAPTGTEKYGAASPYARITKLEDPGFVIDLGEALARAKLPSAPRVLDLGVNTGDALALVRRHVPDARCTGVDHSASALAIARTRFPDATFVEADLARLAALGLGRFDLVLSLGTLQSAGLDDRALLRELVQHCLAPDGAVILALPNCRYVDGETVYGTRMKNFAQPELGLLVKDVAFYRKYLQQHGRQVFVTGKHHVFVTGARVGA